MAQQLDAVDALLLTRAFPEVDCALEVAGRLRERVDALALEAGVD